MTTTRTIIFLLLLFITHSLQAQFGTIQGVVTDSVTEKPMSFVDVTYGPTDGTATDDNGNYEIKIDPGTYEFTFSYIGYKELVQKISVGFEETTTVNIQLSPETNILDQVTVSGATFEKKLTEETVSMDVISQDFVERTNSWKIDKAIDKVPGVNMIGGQANIRGGSGFSYGAGSRVLGCPEPEGLRVQR